MPISFEQPGPVAPGLSAMTGAAEMYGRTHDDFVRMAAQTNQILGQQVHFQQQQQLQAQQAQNQSLLSQQHAAQQLQSDLTIAERNRMQQLQNSRAAVMVDDSLMPEEKQKFLGMIQQGLDPYLAREQAAQRAARQMQMQQMQDHGMMAGMVAKTQQDVFTKSDTGVVPVYAKQMDGGQGPLIGHKVWDGQKYHFHEYHDPMAIQPDVSSVPEGWAVTQEWNAKAGRWHVQMKPPPKPAATPKDVQGEQQAKEDLAENKAVHDFIQHTYTELLKQTVDKQTTTKEGTSTVHTEPRYSPDEALEMAHKAGTRHRQHLRDARIPGSPIGAAFPQGGVSQPPSAPPPQPQPPAFPKTPSEAARQLPGGQAVPPPDVAAAISGIDQHIQNMPPE